jgi:ribosomal protein S7
MKKGHKILANKILNEFLLNLKKIFPKRDIFKIIYNVIKLIKPTIKFVTMKISGKMTKIPIPLNEKQSFNLGLK